MADAPLAQQRRQTPAAGLSILLLILGGTSDVTDKNLGAVYSRLVCLDVSAVVLCGHLSPVYVPVPFMHAAYGVMLTHNSQISLILESLLDTVKVSKS